MKKILFAVAAVVAMSLASCDLCTKCTNSCGTDSVTVDSVVVDSVATDTLVKAE